MAITASSVNLKPHHIALLNDIANYGTAAAATQTTVGQQAAVRKKELEQSCVSELLNVQRLVPATVITTCGIVASPDISGQIANYASQIAANGDPLGMKQAALDALRIHAIENAMVSGKVPAATILSTMS